MSAVRCWWAPSSVCRSAKLGAVREPGAFAGHVSFVRRDVYKEPSPPRLGCHLFPQIPQLFLNLQIFKIRKRHGHVCRSARKVFKITPTYLHVLCPLLLDIYIYHNSRSLLFLLKNDRSVFDLLKYPKDDTSTICLCF